LPLIGRLKTNYPSLIAIAFVPLLVSFVTKWFEPHRVEIPVNATINFLDALPGQRADVLISLVSKNEDLNWGKPNVDISKALPVKLRADPEYQYEGYVIVLQQGHSSSERKVFGPISVEKAPDLGSATFTQDVSLK